MLTIAQQSYFQVHVMWTVISPFSSVHFPFQRYLVWVSLFSSVPRYIVTHTQNIYADNIAYRLFSHSKLQQGKFFHCNSPRFPPHHSYRLSAVSLPPSVGFPSVNYTSWTPSSLSLSLSPSKTSICLCHSSVIFHHSQISPVISY